MTEAVQNAPGPISPTEVSPAASDPLWARLLMPSVADILFVSIFWLLSFGPWGRMLLADADTGWHIRNGEHILRTLSIPRTDYFSYTMAGQPWYAWEWLYDAILGAIHIAAGLNGVVVFTALLIALTFSLLFRYGLQAGGNIVVAAALTVFSAAAATIHFLARPHVATWLLTLIWFRMLQRYQNGARSRLYRLPVIMLLWVNLHGGFLMGLMLIALFMLANLWTTCTASCPARRIDASERLQHLGITGALTIAATFVTPYGYRLYLHLYDYLGSKYLMDHIAEFATPDFHSRPAKFFALLLGVSVLALALAGTKLKIIHLLVVLFAGWSGLFAARNIPIAGILLTLTVAPLVADALRHTPQRSDITERLYSLATSSDDFNSRMGQMEHRFRAHLLPLAVLIAAAAVCLNQGRVLGRTALNLAFDNTRLPVAATEYLVAHDVRDHFFAPDYWSGYLIYRMYPNVRLFMDDRHDFYGEQFVREYLRLLRVQPGWHNVVGRHQVSCILVDQNSSLASLLRGAPGWKIEYEDEVAVLFAHI